MLNVATPAAAGPLAAIASPGNAATDADAGPDFAQVLDQAGAEQRQLKAGKAAEPDLVRMLNDAAGQAPAADTRPGNNIKRGGAIDKVNIAESLAEAQADTKLASAAVKPDEAPALPQARTDDDVPTPHAENDVPPAELMAWVASLPLPPPAPAAEPVAAVTRASPSAPSAEASTVVDAPLAAATGLLRAPAEAVTRKDNAPLAPIAPAMAPTASTRKADPTSARSPLPAAADASAARVDAAGWMQALAAQREGITPSGRSTTDIATALPAMPGSMASPLPRPADTGTPVQAELHAEVGSKEFAPALGSQLSVLVRDGIEHAQLKLNPAEMGPIEVRISIDGSQAQVEFSAAQAHTRQALQDAVPALASALRDNGLTLAGGGVFEQPRDSRGEAQPQARQAGTPHGERAFDDGLPLPQAPRLPRARGVVDLYA